MGDLLAEHLIIDIGMGIDMDQRYRPVLLLHRPQDRQRQRVIAAQGERNAVVDENTVIGFLDDADGLLQIEGVDGDITDIGHLQRLERLGAGRHVIGPEHAAFGPDLARAMARAGAVGGADINRHADETDIQPLGRRLRRQPHHRHRPGKARHVVAAQRLVETCHHLASSPGGSNTTISAAGRERKVVISGQALAAPPWASQRAQSGPSSAVAMAS